MARLELAQAIAVPDEAVTVWCDGCQSSNGFQAAIWAMVPSGLQRIGTMVGCDRCDPDSETIVCFYCQQPVDGGAAFHGHLVQHERDGWR